MERIINFKKQYYSLFTKMIENLKLNAFFLTGRRITTGASTIKAI
jgi:hypothetical protein